MDIHPAVDSDHYLEPQQRRRLANIYAACPDWCLGGPHTEGVDQHYVQVGRVGNVMVELVQRVGADGLPVGGVGIRVESDDVPGRERDLSIPEAGELAELLGQAIAAVELATMRAIVADRVAP